MPNRTWVHNSGMTALLVVLVAVVFVVPAFFPFGKAREILAQFLMSLVLISGVFAIAEHRRTAQVLAALTTALILLVVAEWILPTVKIPGLRDISAMGSFILLAFAVGINVFATGHVIRDRLFGAVVLYLLLGLIWAVAYHVLNTLTPRAFTGQPALNADLADWVYFSFVTLTTVGYGDITPAAQSARSLAILEALVGQLFPAVIIARLVSLQDSSR